MKDDIGTEDEKYAITILVGEDETRIELHDRISTIAFAKVTLTARQLSMALSRRSYTPCNIKLAGLDKIGKRMEVDKLEFRLPNEPDFRNRKQLASSIADKVCPEGWQHDNYFGSQDSFFKRDGEDYAKVTIRRWVSVDESKP